MLISMPPSAAQIVMETSPQIFAPQNGMKAFWGEV